tara:strand:- start:538 stop:1479 length:942 start_codon:yes stop_codon:yes gene_type:complete
MIKIISVRFIIAIFVIFLSTEIKFSVLASENKILLKVNNELITSIDILNEINYLKSINKDIDNLENKKIIEIARNSLIKYKIKKIALMPIVKKMEISDDDFKRVLISNYSITGFTKIDEINQHLKNYNIKPKLIRNKMTINAIWSQFIYDKYSKNIKIDIDKLKQDIQRNEGQTEYLLSEIIFDLKEKETVNEKFNIIKNAINENGFANTALIYSISETSTSGGNIGWVSENSINKKILKKIMEIDINNFTEPLVIPGGYLILNINEKRITKKDIKLEDELKKIVQIKTNEQLNQFSNIFLNKIKKDIVINEP